VTENEQSEPIVVVIQNEIPTVKQQLITAGTQLGIALAIPVFLAGSMGVAAGVGKVRSKIAARKALKHAPLTVVPSIPTED